MLEYSEIVKVVKPQCTFFQVHYHMQSFVNLGIKKWTRRYVLKDVNIFDNISDAEDYAKYVIEPWTGKVINDKTFLPVTTIEQKLQKFGKMYDKFCDRHYVYRLVRDTYSTANSYAVVLYEPSVYFFSDSSFLLDKLYWEGTAVLSERTMALLDKAIDDWIAQNSDGKETVVSTVRYMDRDHIICLPKAAEKRNECVHAEIKRTEKYLDFLKKIS